MAEDKIKRVIRDFVSFDIENDYYQKEMKEDIVRMFKKILFEDDVTVRKFLQDFFKNTKDLANEYSLVATDEEAQSDENEEDEENTEDTQEQNEENPDENDEESSGDENGEEQNTDEKPEEEKTVIAPESKQEDVSKSIFERYTEIASDYLY